MASDRVGAASLPLTQELVSAVLGVRRASVSKAAEALQAMGLIRYQRGQVLILDRTRLEAAACECYGYMSA